MIVLFYDILDFSKKKQIFRKNLLSFSYTPYDKNNLYKYNDGLAISKFYGNFELPFPEQKVCLNINCAIKSTGYDDRGYSPTAYVIFPGNDNLRICLNYNGARAITIYKYVASDKPYGHPYNWWPNFHIFSILISNNNYRYYIDGNYVTDVAVNAPIKNFQVCDGPSCISIKWISLTSSLNLSIPDPVLYKFISKNNNIYD